MTNQPGTDHVNDPMESGEWEDGGEAEIRQPVKSPRAVVSVSFSATDLERVSDEARRCGMKLSEFVRTAALESANRSQGGSAVTSSSGATVDYRMNRSRSASYRAIQETPEAVTAT